MGICNNLEELVLFLPSGHMTYKNYTSGRRGGKLDVIAKSHHSDYEAHKTSLRLMKCESFVKASGDVTTFVAPRIIQLRPHPARVSQS